MPTATNANNNSTNYSVRGSRENNNKKNNNDTKSNSLYFARTGQVQFPPE